MRVSSAVHGKVFFNQISLLKSWGAVLSVSLEFLRGCMITGHFFGVKVTFQSRSSCQTPTQTSVNNLCLWILVFCATGTFIGVSKHTACFLSTVCRQFRFPVWYLLLRLYKLFNQQKLHRNISCMATRVCILTTNYTGPDRLTNTNSSQI